MSVDQYIAQFPEDIQAILNKIRALCKDSHQGIEEKISYGMPAFKFKASYLCYFAAYKKHIGFYGLPETHTEFQVKLSKYKTGKGSVQFPLNQAIPYDIIQEMLNFRLAQIQKNGK